MTGATPDIADLKRDLRKRCEERRSAINPSVRQTAAHAIAMNGLAFTSASAPAVVSAYSALGSEIDPGPLMSRLAQDGFTAALPVITPLGRPLIFRTWRPGDPLVPRKWGILEPSDDAGTVEPDILLVPLLAFDRRGGRLGYGGGYYDRTLERLRAMKRIIVVGLAFAEQEIDAVPVQPHDQRLDWVLTPYGAIDTRSV